MEGKQEGQEGGVWSTAHVATPRTENLDFVRVGSIRFLIDFKGGIPRSIRNLPAVWTQRSRILRTLSVWTGDWPWAKASTLVVPRVVLVRPARVGRGVVIVTFARSPPARANERPLAPTKTEQ